MMSLHQGLNMKNKQTNKEDDKCFNFSKNKTHLNWSEVSSAGRETSEHCILVPFIPLLLSVECGAWSWQRFTSLASALQNKCEDKGLERGQERLSQELNGLITSFKTK